MRSPLVEVEYEPLPPVVDPYKALEPESPLVRPDREQKTNHIWHWEAATQRAPTQPSTSAEVVVKEDIYIPRIHVCSIETCGCVASFDKVERQADHLDDHPGAARHPHRLLAGDAASRRHKIRIISPDIGGGFGGKVPVYPGYVIATAPRC